MPPPQVSKSWTEAEKFNICTTNLVFSQLLVTIRFSLYFLVTVVCYWIFSDAHRITSIAILACVWLRMSITRLKRDEYHCPPLSPAWMKGMLQSSPTLKPNEWKGAALQESFCLCPFPVGVQVLFRELCVDPTDLLIHSKKVWWVCSWAPWKHQCRKSR